MFRKSFSPSIFGLRDKKVQSHLFFRGGSENNVSMSDETFFDIMSETIDIESDPDKDKPRRLSNREV